MLRAEALVTTNPPPVQMFARSAGALQLLVKNGEEIQVGQTLGYIQNPTNWQKVQRLEELLCDFSPAEFLSSSSDFKTGLGELQPYYDALLTAFLELEINQKYPLTTYQAEILRDKIIQKKSLEDNLQEKYQLDQHIFSQAEKSYQTDSLLVSQKVKTPVELYQAKSAYLRQLQSLKNSETNLLNYNEQLQDIQAQVGELQLRNLEQSAKLNLAISQAFQNLQTQITLWKDRYVISSPVSGKVNLLTYWADHQYIRPDQEVMTITQTTRVQTVKVYLPIQGAGKVKTGQKVWLSLYDYPDEEFGKVKGEIVHMSTLSQEINKQSEAGSQYILDVKLTQALETDRGKTLQFKPEMQGEANIITKPYSLLARIMNPIVASISGI